MRNILKKQFVQYIIFLPSTSAHRTHGALTRYQISNIFLIPLHFKAIIQAHPIYIDFHELNTPHSINRKKIMDRFFLSGRSLATSLR